MTVARTRWKDYHRIQVQGGVSKWRRIENRIRPGRACFVVPHRSCRGDMYNERLATYDETIRELLHTM